MASRFGVAPAEPGQPRASPAGDRVERVPQGELAAGASSLAQPAPIRAWQCLTLAVGDGAECHGPVDLADEREPDEGERGLPPPVRAGSGRPRVRFRPGRRFYA